MATIRLARCLTAIAAAAAVSTGLAAAAGRVVGGNPIQIQSVPWTVYVQNQTPTARFLCTGSILDSTHVLTAAHCVYDESGNIAQPSGLAVRAGVSDFSAPLATDAEQDRGVASFRVHPGYLWTSRSTPDDVAVLALASPLDLSGPAVQAIALPPLGAPFPAGATVGIAGFGRQSPTVNASGPLAWMTATVDAQGSCGGPTGASVLADDAIIVCASSATSAACNGDSGSGLVTADTHILVGVVSAGSPACGAGSHTLYTYIGAPEILRFLQGDDQPPTAPRETSLTYVNLKWDPPLVVGNSLECSSGNWAGSPTLTYSFLDADAGDVLQSGASSTYRIVSADVGHTIYCQVTASNDGGSAVDQTTTTFKVKPPPQLTILRIPPVAVAPGGDATLRISLHAPAGLWGKFGVCVTAPPRVGGRICSSEMNTDGASGNFPFTLRFRIKPSAPPIEARIAVAAVAGISRAHATAIVEISRAT